MIAGGPLSGLCVAPGVCAGPALGAGGGAVAGPLASSVAGSVISAFGSALSGSSAWLVGHVLQLIESTTEPQLGDGWFGSEVALMTRVSLVVVLPLLLAATIGAVLRQDGRRLFRVWGVGLPIAVLAGLAGPQLAEWGLATSDALSAQVLGPNAEHFGHQFSAGMVQAAGDPLFVGIIVSVLTLAGAVVLWLELVVRSAGVYVATFFMPLALAAYIWPATAGVARRAVEILVSLILAKFVIVTSLSLGAAALAGGGVDATLSGAAILLVAAFAPFVLLRLAPVVEASAIAHMEGLSRRPGRAAARATAAVAAPSHPVTALVMSGRAGRWVENATGQGAGHEAGGQQAGGGGLRPGAVQPQPVPTRAPDYRFPSSPSEDGSHD